MSSDNTLENLFNEALEREDPVERARFLDEACGPDAVLRKRVEKLLGAHAEAVSFMPARSSRSAGPDFNLAVNMMQTEKPGDRIDRYKLLQAIGEGGCGLVYMAEQEEGVRRRVALKVIKLGMDTREVIARFEAERQALALMDHPNIAKVLDAGATAGGRPYFVMELVRGVKITEFCDENKLSTEARLKLFVQVCQAIQHAHQKGIIHRDIKPSNILVTVNDGEPVPKVIDFGIAKATQGRLTDKTLFTAFEQFIGTPAYMSPEQAVMTSLDIDTRSDIYSLGVLLYELLTGTTPFDTRRLLTSGLEELRRTIREEDPVRPSARLSALDMQTAKELLRNRQERLPSLVHLVQGDLDWIVMKCLEKDRSRRYETTSGLAADINRYLRNEPVLARPPSQLYSLQKMARRNRVALTAATFVVLTLLMAVVVLAISNVRIRHEQSLKEAALKTAQESEQQAKAQLFVSLKSQAETRRYSRRIGQRLESLEALSKAAQINRDEDLRDAVIATLAVPDLRPGPAWQAYGTNDLVITFDVNYERYARIDSHSMISIRTVADDREIQRFSSGPALQRPGKDRGFLFSPDGRFLAKFEVDDRWSIWRVDDGQLVLRTLPTSSSAFAFSGDSAQVALPLESSIVIFDLHTGQERQRWSYQHKPHVLAFSAAGRHLAAGPLESEVISIFDAENGQLLSELPVGASFERPLTWHPSGKYLAVTSYEHVQLWDVKARAKVTSLEGHAQAVTALSFDPSGAWLISDSWDGTPRLWQPSPGREWMRFFSGMGNLKFSRDGRRAGVLFPGGGKAQLLEFIPSQVYHTFVGSLIDSQHSFNHADISADGRLLALASSKGVSLRELPSGRELGGFPSEIVWRVQFHPNGKELLISGNSGFEVWTISRDTPASNEIRLRPLRRIALSSVVHDFVLAQDGRTIALTAAHVGEARIVDLYTGTLRDLKFPNTMTDYVALTPDARFLAASGWHSTRAQLWNAQTGERLLNLAAERARVAFTPDGRELVVSMSGAYVFYDVTTQKVTRRFQRQGSMHGGWITFSRDGRLMAMELSPGAIRLCEVQTGRTIAHLQDPTGDLNSWMAFTPDGTQLIVAAVYARAIHRWDLRAMRTELKAMGLDWDWPEFPPSSDEEKNPPPLKLQVAGALP